METLSFTLYMLFESRSRKAFVLTPSSRNLDGGGSLGSGPVQLLERAVLLYVTEDGGSTPGVNGNDENNT